MNQPLIDRCHWVDGVFDLITVADSPDFTLGTQDFTIALWACVEIIWNFTPLIGHDEMSGIRTSHVFCNALQRNVLLCSFQNWNAHSQRIPRGGSITGTPMYKGFHDGGFRTETPMRKGFHEKRGMSCRDALTFRPEKSMIGCLLVELGQEMKLLALLLVIGGALCVGLPFTEYMETWKVAEHVTPSTLLGTGVGALCIGFFMLVATSR